MIRELLYNCSIAIVGAGRIGRAFLETVCSARLSDLNVRVLGVADRNPQAPGLETARKYGIPTTSDLRNLLELKDLDILIELTGQEQALRSLRRNTPAHVRLVEHHEAILLLHFLQVEDEKRRHLERIEQDKGDPHAIQAVFESFSQKVMRILSERTRHLEKIENEILKRDHVLSQIVDNTTIPTFVINNEHIVTHWNRACEKLTGYLADEIVGTDNQWLPFRPAKRPVMADVIVDDLSESEIRKYYGEHWQKSDLIEGAYQAEEYFPHFGDAGKWLFFTAAPIKAPDGALIGAIETLWDRTERLEARRKLKEYADNLENMVKKATEEIGRRSDFQDKLIKSSNDGIVATDEEGVIVIYNKGAERIFGYPAEEVLGKFSIDRIYPPDVAADILAGLTQNRDVDSTRWQELSITDRSGETVPTRFSVSVLYQEAEVIGSVCFFRDLREIKRLQRELVKSERLAAIGQTIAGLAHYIKNILYGLKGGVFVVNTALERQETKRTAEGWKMVERNIGRIGDLVYDLLTYSKERGPEPQNCFPNKIVEEVCALMSAKAEENRIRLKMRLDPDVGEVFMDPKAIHRSLLNLVSNAIDACIEDKATPPKKRILVETRLSGNRTLQFAVSDNGIGMNKATVDRLFSDLFSTKGQRGTGLGLLVTSKIVKENGGEIRVSSSPGKGATFTMQLPFQKVAPHLREG